MLRFNIFRHKIVYRKLFIVSISQIYLTGITEKEYF